MKRAVRTVLLTFIVLGSLTIAAMIAVWAHPPLALLGLALYRGNPVCSAVQIYRSAEYRMFQAKTREEILPQFRQLDSEGSTYRLWDTPDGRYWTPDSNDKVLPILVAQQMTGIYRVTSNGRSARRGDVVIDCGAHIGTYSRRVVQEGAAKVVSIEPAPANVECLRRNLADQITAGSVIVEPVGVWDKQDTLTLFEDPQNSAAAGFVHPGGRRQPGIRVPLTTIDKLVKDIGLPKVDIIKMDIKGATARALEGARETIARHHPILVISTEEDDDDPAGLLAIARRIDSRYRLTCTNCAMENWIVRPEVIVLQ